MVVDWVRFVSVSVVVSWAGLSWICTKDDSVRKRVWQGWKILGETATLCSNPQRQRMHLDHTITPCFDVVKQCGSGVVLPDLGYTAAKRPSR